MQEQEPNSPLDDPVGIEADPVAVDSPVRHTTSGKEVTFSIYFSTKNMKKKSPDVYRCQC